jgi:CheY-like chemotaxis protein
MSDFSTNLDLEHAHTEITYLREALREAVADAARTKEEANEKILGFAREFRVPLTTILGFGDILSAADKSHPSEWNQIAIAGHQLMELIQNLERPETAPHSSYGQVRNEEESLPSVLHTILHIEDNETNFRLTQRILEDRPNIELLWAPTGEQGLELACKHTPSLILLDLNLPDTHGSDVLVQLRNNPFTEKIPVIVLSADASPTRIERMLQTGARDYLTKPFDIKRLLCLVDDALTQQLQPAAL